MVPVSLEDEPEQTSLLKSEFVRAISCAKSALNKDAGAELRHIAANFWVSTLTRRLTLDLREAMSEVDAEDMAWKALVHTARDVAPNSGEDFLRKAYEIQRRHQFSRDRSRVPPSHGKIDRHPLGGAE